MIDLTGRLIEGFPVPFQGGTGINIERRAVLLGQTSEIAGFTVKAAIFLIIKIIQGIFLYDCSTWGCFCSVSGRVSGPLRPHAARLRHRATSAVSLNMFIG